MKPKSCLPNPFGNQGFIIGWEPAFLGNCLSSFANLVAFSIRNSIPIIYPNITKYNNVFLDPDRIRYIFDPAGSIDANFALNFSSSVTPLIADVASVEYEELRDFSCQGITLFLSNEPVHKIRDWNDDSMESIVSRFCKKGNGLIMPRVYWNQYTDMRTAAFYGPALREHLGRLRSDGLASRSEHMKTHEGYLKIGIHIRQSDSRTWYNGAYFYSIEDYIRVISCLHVALASTPHVFYVFSEHVWSRSVFGDLPVFCEPGEFQDDFAIMGMCDYLVGPPSTFATWSAFFGGAKRIILTRERINDIGSIQSVLDLAVEIPFPTGGYLPGDLRAGPL